VSLTKPEVLIDLVENHVVLRVVREWKAMLLDVVNKIRNLVRWTRHTVDVDPAVTEPALATADI
jgi:hypothetical protein